MTPDAQKAVDAAPLKQAWIPKECDPTTLYPTHPQQNLKRWEQHQIATYNLSKVPAGEADKEGVCTIKTNQEKPSCLRATDFQHVVVSDTYQDKCGNQYRGAVAKAFLTKNE